MKQEVAAAARAIRMARFVALCEQYGIEIKSEGPWTDSASEDASLIVDGTDPLHRWIAVTKAGEFIYLAPCESRQEAINRTVEYVCDDIYAESPLAIVDLDRGGSRGACYPLVALVPTYASEPKEES